MGPLLVVVGILGLAALAYFTLVKRRFDKTR
jgi:hypothetical protein